MDHSRFDSITREIASRVSRRGLIALLAMGIGVVDAPARKRKRKKKKPATGCPTCGTCRTCRNGSCVPLPDDTACGQCGRCLNGACANALDRANLCGACATCEAGACVNKPVYTPCDGGPDLCTLPVVCYNGACNEGACYYPPSPYCQATTEACTVDSDCCSRACCRILGTEVRYCCASEPGGTCLTDGDCVAGASCVAYRCYT